MDTNTSEDLGQIGVKLKEALDRQAQQNGGFMKSRDIFDKAQNDFGADKFRLFAEHYTNPRNTDAGVTAALYTLLRGSRGIGLDLRIRDANQRPLNEAERDAVMVLRSAKFTAREIGNMLGFSIPAVNYYLYGRGNPAKIAYIKSYHKRLWRKKKATKSGNPVADKAVIQSTQSTTRTPRTPRGAHRARIGAVLGARTAQIVPWSMGTDTIYSKASGGLDQTNLYGPVPVLRQMSSLRQSLGVRPPVFLTALWNVAAAHYDELINEMSVLSSAVGLPVKLTDSQAAMLQARSNGAAGTQDVPATTVMQPGAMTEINDRRGGFFRRWFGGR